MWGALGARLERQVACAGEEKGAYEARCEAPINGNSVQDP